MFVVTIWSCLIYSALAAKDFSNLIFEEDFSKGINFALWKHEIVSHFYATSRLHLTIYLFRR